MRARHHAACGVHRTVVALKSSLDHQALPGSDRDERQSPTVLIFRILNLKLHEMFAFLPRQTFKAEV